MCYQLFWWRILRGFYRWWLPLDNDPKKGMLMQASDWTTKNLGGIPIPQVGPFGSFVIPYSYIITIAIAAAPLPIVTAYNPVFYG